MSNGHREVHEVGQRIGLEFLEHAGAMDVDGAWAGPECPRDFLGRTTGGEQVHHLPLARGQASDAAGRIGRGGAGGQGAAVMLQRPADGIQDRVGRTGLFEEVHRPGFHRPHRCRDLGKSRHDNDRQPDSPLDQARLELQPVESRHAEVRQNAAGARKIGIQQGLSAVVGAHGQTLGFQ